MIKKYIKTKQLPTIVVSKYSCKYPFTITKSLLVECITEKCFSNYVKNGSYMLMYISDQFIFGCTSYKVTVVVLNDSVNDLIIHQFKSLQVALQQMETSP